jgi:hypothetical protein
VFHSLFAPLLDPLPQEALANADRLGKIDVMNAFMEANPYAVYTAIIAHGMGAFAGVFFATRTINAYDRKYDIDRPTWIGPLLVAGMWMYMDIEQDLNLAPYRQHMDDCRCIDYCRTFFPRVFFGGRRT